MSRRSTFGFVGNGSTTHPVPPISLSKMFDSTLLCVCVRMDVYVCMCVYMYVCVCICIRMCTCRIFICLGMYIGVGMCSQSEPGDPRRGPGETQERPKADPGKPRAAQERTRICPGEPIWRPRWPEPVLVPLLIRASIEMPPFGGPDGQGRFWCPC